MNTVQEILEFVEENNVKFVKLAFCDILGQQKNISIMSDKLKTAFEEGIQIDGSQVKGFSDVVQPDIYVIPDPSTLAILPWRQGPGRVIRFFCNLKNYDGTPFIKDSRQILVDTISKLDTLGYVCEIGSECEFYLFKNDENGDPTNITIDNGSYLDIAPLDKGENIRRDICVTMEEMDLHPKTSYHENGPGQNEIDFKLADPLSSADNFLAFKSVVAAISARSGFYASFQPKPLPGESGSSLHINLALTKNGKNIFTNSKTEHSQVGESFIAGILEKSREITLFLNSTKQSYDRFGKFDAPMYVSWSHHNSSQLIRILTTSKNDVRMELRSPDPMLNPYLAFSLILSAGIYGIENNIKLTSPVNEDLFSAPPSVTDRLDKLPHSIDSAIELAENSTFITDAIGEQTKTAFINTVKKLAV